MPVSNGIAIAAVGLTVIKEIPNFIKKKDEDIDPYYITLSVIVSSLWLFYYHSNNNQIGKIASTFFLGINLVLLVKCLQQRTGFLTGHTSRSK